MRVALQHLFLVAYLLSSYATAQGRVLYLVEELQHATSRTDDRAFDSDCRDRPHFTHFREAKKSGSDPGDPERPAPAFIRLELGGPSTSYHAVLPSVVSLEISHSRAPPSARHS